MCKDVLANLGANKTPRAIVRAGKAAGNLRDILTQYDATNTIDHGSGMHTHQSEEKDVASIVKELHKQRVFGLPPPPLDQHVWSWGTSCEQSGTARQPYLYVPGGLPAPCWVLTMTHLMNRVGQSVEHMHMVTKISPLWTIQGDRTFHGTPGLLTA